MSLDLLVAADAQSLALVFEVAVSRDPEGLSTADAILIFFGLRIDAQLRLRQILLCALAGDARRQLIERTECRRGLLMLAADTVLNDPRSDRAVSAGAYADPEALQVIVENSLFRLACGERL